MTEIDLQPVLVGARLQLRPLQPSDFEALALAAADPLIWQQHPEPTRYQPDVFRKFFEAGLASGGALLVTDKATGRVLGSSRYYDYDPAAQEIAIGYTFLIRDAWGGMVNGELKHLMLEHVFQWVSRVWLHIGKHNQRSRKAAEKIGAVFDRLEPRELGGQLVDYAYYRLDRDGSKRVVMADQNR